ncbi:MAG: galactokinase [Planctomycetota bacterium]
MGLEASAPLADLVASVRAEFEQRFGRPAGLVVAAPGRVNVIGEHTDYNGGFVLPMAIDRYTVVAAAMADHNTVCLRSATMGDEATLSLSGADDSDRQQTGWAKYARGVIDAFADRGLAAPAMDAVIGSTVPLGGGLSSSAALEVALATAMGLLAGWEIDGQALALACQDAEHRAGTPCGIMDQFASTLCEADHLMLLDCRDRSVKMQPMDDPDVVVLIANSNVKHELTGGEYAERRDQCETAARTLGVETLRDATLAAAQNAGLEDTVFRRARHVIGEIARTPDAAAAIAARDWSEAGRLMYASHASLRDDFAVSCPELDALVDAAEEIGPSGGVIGSRMTGGGFGGCTVSLVDAARANEVAERLGEAYAARTGKQATLFVTRPARGAHVVGE